MSLEMKEYIQLFWKKILENLTSVKVWFFILPFFVSTGILIWLTGAHLLFIKHSLEAITTNQQLFSELISKMQIITDMFIAWCTFNVSLIGTIIVVREVFKVNKLKAVNEAAKIANGSGNPEDSIKQIKNVNI